MSQRKPDEVMYLLF